MAESKPIVICAIAKNEHLYINDWVKYHIDLGFDHIYIFDNDDKTSRFLGDYIDTSYADKVSFFDVRERKGQWFQQDCYNQFYQNYNQTFDWCAFIDIDEFIVLNAWPNIRAMVDDDRFKPFSSIKICWRLYGDDEVIKRDIRVPVYSFFKNTLTNHPLVKQGKQITRGGLKGADIRNHGCYLNGSLAGQCTVAGTACYERNGSIDINGRYLFNDCYLNHYMSKTLDEFLNQKFNRGDAMFATREIDADYFWRINKRTQEKIDYINKYTRHKLPEPIKILVASCDKNQDTFFIFHRCMDKYWSNHPEIIYSTESIENRYYKTIQKNYPLSQWTRRIRETAQEIDSEYILLMVDDLFLRKPVDNRTINSLPKMFSENTAAFNFEKTFDPFDIPVNGLYSKRNPVGPYKTSAMCQLWNREKLIKVLNDDLDPWQFERHNNHFNYEYLISNTGDIIDFGYYDNKGNKKWFGLHNGKWCKEDVTFFKIEGFNIDFLKRGFND